MKEIQSVFTSDSINLYMQKFTAGSLISALSDRWNIGIPMHVSHDLTRLAGWARPTMVYFEPGLTRLAGINLLPESNEEMKLVSDAQRVYIETCIEKMCTPELMGSLKAKIKNHLKGDEIPYETHCVTLYRKGLAQEIFSDIFAAADKDLLIPTSLLNYVGDGLFERDGLLLFAHPWFRRSNTRLNSLNTVFLDRFFEALKKNRSKGLIALDPDLIGLAGTQRQHFEHEYWWGPKFSDDLVSIPTGVTVHNAPEYERFFYSISSTEFWWQSRDDQHILEIEELRDRPGTLEDGSLLFGCRYVHSIVDEKNKSIVHLDGAIRGYIEEEMVSRLELKINNAGKRTLYKKLWRMDIPVAVNEWKSLISDYFRDNHLIGEYFGINAEEKDGRPRLINKDKSPDLVRKYVPYTIERGSGIRVGVSFHNLSQNISESLEAISTDSISIGNEKFAVLPSDAIEVAKACSRFNLQLRLPTDVRYIAFEDLYTDLPLLIAPARDTGVVIGKLMGLFRALVTSFVSRNQDRILSFTIGIPLVDRELRISVMGAIADILKWLESPCASIPLCMEDLHQWANKLGDYLASEFKSSNDSPRLGDIYNTSGIFFFERQPIQPSEYSVHYSEKERGLVYDLRIPAGQEDLAKALNDGKLELCCSFLIESSKCSRCKSEYRTCSCSKYLDGVGQIVSSCQAAFAYISDRPAIIRKE